MIQTVTLSGNTFRVSAPTAKSRKFWSKADSGKWEAETLEFVCEKVDANTTFIDIGAWIGPISLIAGQRAKRVIALEPDPTAVRELETNLALNGVRADIWPAAISSGDGDLRLFAAKEFGDSKTSSLGVGKFMRVPTVSFADIDAKLEPGSKVVVKMDIEGHEYRVAEQLVEFIRRHGAPLNLSLHPRILFIAKRRSLGYIMARLKAYLATWGVIERLYTVGSVRLAKTGEEITRFDVLRFTLLKSRPKKTFSVNVYPRSA